MNDLSNEKQKFIATLLHCRSLRCWLFSNTTTDNIKKYGTIKCKIYRPRKVLATSPEWKNPLKSGNFNYGILLIMEYRYLNCICTKDYSELVVEAREWIKDCVIKIGKEMGRKKSTRKKTNTLYIYIYTVKRHQSEIPRLACTINYSASRGSMTADSWVSISQNQCGKLVTAFA